MFVIQATCQGLTRRLTFDTRSFPYYTDIQKKLVEAFELPADSRPLWVSVLYYPNEKRPSRIMFKRHVCDAFEYENAQGPFLRTSFPSPGLSFTVHLAEDVDVADIKLYHRGTELANKCTALGIESEKLEKVVEDKEKLLAALEAKADESSLHDSFAGEFWRERLAEKAAAVELDRERLTELTIERIKLSDELSGPAQVLTEDYSDERSLRRFLEQQDEEEARATGRTQDDLAAWQESRVYSGDDIGQFPPLEHVLAMPTGPRHQLHPTGRTSARLDARSLDPSTGWSPLNRGGPSQPPSRSRVRPTTCGTHNWGHVRPRSNAPAAPAPTPRAPVPERLSAPSPDLFLRQDEPSAPTRPAQANSASTGSLFQAVRAAASELSAQYPIVVPRQTEATAPTANQAPAATRPYSLHDSVFAQQPPMNMFPFKTNAATRPPTFGGSGLFGSFAAVNHDSIFSQPRGTETAAAAAPVAAQAQPPAAATPAVAAEDVPTMPAIKSALQAALDGFLCNLTNQLAETFETFESSARAVDQSTATEATTAMPGAFQQVDATAQTQTPSAPASDVRTAPAALLGKGGFKHRHITCDGCERSVRGIRYKCKTCPDYDLCGTCLPLLSNSSLHPIDHEFTSIMHSDLESRVKSDKDIQQESVRHPATCDQCSEAIVGVRHKCIICPDWDCCDACSQQAAVNHPGHAIVKIHSPSDLVDPSRRHAVFGVRHPGIICDGCRQLVRGVRYKCMHPSCPDYDLCENCEAHPTVSHPQNHPMLKIKEPTNVEHESSFDEIPKVRIEPAKPTLCDFQVREAAWREQSRYYGCTQGDTPQRRWDHERCLEHATLDECQRDYVPFKGAKTGPRLGSRGRSNRDHASVTKSRMQTMPGVYIALDCEDGGRCGHSVTNRPRMASAEATPLSQQATAQDKPKVEAESALGGSPSQNQMVRDEETPHIIKCYAYPETLAICPAKPDSEIEPQQSDEPSTAMPIASGAQTPMKQPVTPHDIFTWVRHMTMTPGGTLPAGAEFTKVWKIKHFASGHEYDFDTIRLVHKSDGQLGQACKVDIKYNKDEIKDGDEFDVVISGLRVPNTPGEEVLEHWRFEDSQGIAYGQPLRIRFFVEGPQSLANSLSRSSMIMPTPNREVTPPIASEIETYETASQAPTLAQSSIPSTPTTSASPHDETDDDIISLQSSEDDDEDDEFDVVPSAGSPSVGQYTPDELEIDDFDFVDESEEEDE